MAVARLGGTAPLGALAGFTDAPAALARRVAVLCEPPWSRSTSKRAVGIAGVLCGIVLVALAVAFDRQLHDAAESLLQVLGT